MGYISLDGGVLTNQAIHLLDMLIYVFGPIKYFDAMASYNKSKLEAEDLIIINFKHKNGILSSFKATTRANRNYRTAIDVIGSKGRYIVKGIALNTFNIFTKNYASYFNIHVNKVELETIKNSPLTVKDWTRDDFKKLANERYNLRIPSYYIENILH